MPDTEANIVYVIDDNKLLRQTIDDLMSAAGFRVRTFSSGVAFLEAQNELPEGAVLLDMRMPKMDGLSVLQKLKERWPDSVIIMMSGYADLPMAVEAMKSGAYDFVEKPFSPNQIVPLITGASQQSQIANDLQQRSHDAKARLDRLSKRELEVLEHVVAGNPNKVVGQLLGISHRTVEVHRARMMQRLGVKTFAELMRLAVLGGIKPS